MFYLVRHGESVGNAANRYQTADVLLSDVGRMQAAKRAMSLLDKNITRVITSPFLRAYETAQIIHQALDPTLPLEKYHYLHELEPPTVLKGRLKTDPDAVAIKAEITANRLDRDYRHSDEETLFMLHQRVLNLLDYLVPFANENILLVSHGGLLRMLLAYLQTQADPYTAVAKHLELEKDLQSPINNVAMITFEYQNGQWQLHHLDNIF
jgi:broad specificity phosphatase PhoE